MIGSRPDRNCSKTDITRLSGLIMSFSIGIHWLGPGIYQLNQLYQMHQLRAAYQTFKFILRLMISSSVFSGSRRTLMNGGCGLVEN